MSKRIEPGALQVEGVITARPSANRAFQISRSGSNHSGLSIANGDRTYGIAIDATGAVLKIQEDADGSPRVHIDAANNQVGFVATAGVTNANFYHPATEQPAAIVSKSSDQGSVIGGTNITFDTEHLDRGADFASSTFTAPVTGDYLLAGCVELYNNSGGATTLHVTLGAYVNGTTTWMLSGVPSLANGQRCSLPISGMLPLTAGDTVTIRCISGGGVTLTAVGTAASRLTWWGIRLAL